MSNRVVLYWQAIASVFGLGQDWDVGKDASERRQIREASRQLRESLSTFVDPRDELINPTGEAYNDFDTEDDSTETSALSPKDDGSPPDLRRIS